MSLAEGVAARIAYKAYTDPTITPGVEPVAATDPGASGGQLIRRVSSSLALSKDTYQSAEIRPDRQIADFRHGTKRVQGNISGELSPLTYKDFFAAACRGNWSVAAVTGDQTGFTSLAADNATAKLTFGGGNPISAGLRAGMVIRFTDLSAAANNGKNFVILAIGGGSNRELTVYPAPVTMTADTAFSFTTVGRQLIVPASSHVRRKLAVEIYNEDLDISRLFTELRVGGFNAQMPATGMSTVDFEFMGRNMQLLTGGSAPFFTAPSAVTTTGLLAAVNGLLRVSGTTVAVVTGANIQLNLNPSAEAVVGSNLVPEIFLGRANVTGQLTAFFDSPDLIQDYINEEEIELLTYLTATSAVNSPAMTFFLPRLKLGGADIQTQGEGGQSITLPFQGLKYEGSAPGVENTTLQIVDTEVS